MKLIHLSDIHIGKRVNGYSMIEDQKYILQQIIEAIDTEKPDAVMIAGDIYDRSSPSAEAVALYDEFLSEMASREHATLIISGNHDMAQNIAFGNRIIENSGIYLSPVYDGEVRKVELTDSHGPVHFYLLPFIRPANVRAAFEDADIHSYSDAVQTAVNAMAADGSVRNVLITHQFVTGAVRSDSEDLSVGGTDGVDISIFEPFDYVALGHLHHAQKVVRDTVRYCGSPLKYSVSEATDSKSITIIEMEEKGKCEIRQLLLTPQRDLRVIKGTYEELTLLENYQGTATDDYLHVILTDEHEIPEAMGKLRAIYPNIMDLVYENLRTASQQFLDPTAAPEKMDPLELFGQLYNTQNNTEMTEEQTEYIRELVEKIWRNEA